MIINIGTAVAADYCVCDMYAYLKSDNSKETYALNYWHYCRHWL
jgi:hypothetical protein